MMCESCGCPIEDDRNLCEECERKHAEALEEGYRKRIAELEAHAERGKRLLAGRDEKYHVLELRYERAVNALQHIADRFVRHATVYNDEWREAWNKAHPEDQKIPLDETSEGAIYARVARAALAATPDGGVAPAETRVGISSYG